MDVFSEDSNIFEIFIPIVSKCFGKGEGFAFYQTISVTTNKVFAVLRQFM